jgi:hypothetical protein
VHLSTSAAAKIWTRLKLVQSLGSTFPICGRHLASYVLRPKTFDSGAALANRDSPSPNLPHFTSPFHKSSQNHFFASPSRRLYSLPVNIRPMKQQLSHHIIIAAKNLLRLLSSLTSRKCSFSEIFPQGCFPPPSGLRRCCFNPPGILFISQSLLAVNIWRTLYYFHPKETRFLKLK